MGYWGQVGVVWGSGRWGIGDFSGKKIGCMGVEEVEYGDQVGGVWRSGMWGMVIFLAKNGVYGDGAGGVWAWKGWGMGTLYPPFQPPLES